MTRKRPDSARQAAKGRSQSRSQGAASSAVGEDLDGHQAGHRPPPAGGMVVMFLMLNGFIASLCFAGALFFVADNLKTTEVTHQTRDIIRSINEQIVAIDKTVQGLARYLAQDSTDNKDGLSAFVAEILPETRSLSALYWATPDKAWAGVYSTTAEASGTRDLVASASSSTSSPAASEGGQKGKRQYQGPDYATLQALYPEGRIVPGQMVVLLDVPEWQAEERAEAKTQTSPQESPRLIGLLYAGAKSADDGILLAVGQPETLLGRSWATRRNELRHLVIRDQKSDRVIVENTFPFADGKEPFFGTLPVTYRFTAGDRIWAMDMQVLPTPAGQALQALPWAGLLLGMCVTLAAAGFVYARQRHLRRLAEMNLELEGATVTAETSREEQDRLFSILRKRERENRALINSVSDIIFEADVDGTIRFLNETWERITGIDRKSALDRPLFDFIHEDERREQKEKFQQLIHGERQTYRNDIRIRDAGGNYKIVEMAFSMMRMAEDKTMRVVGTMTDIEKRLRAEIALREAERKYRGIFENSASGIYQSTPDGKFINANPAMARILGYETPEELMREVVNIGKQIYINPKDRVSFAARIEAQGEVAGLETEVRRRDGKTIWITENARAVRDDKGRLLYYEGVIDDATERKKVSRMLQDAKLQAEITNRAKSDFIANMSHELRTPLNAIIGFSEIIKGEVLGPLGQPSYKEYAQDIFDSGTKLLNIISEILEISRIDAGERELRESNFPLGRVLRSCEIILGHKMQTREIALENRIPENFPELLGEELALKQIMIHVLGNAIKFNQPRGKISVSAALNADGEMEIAVTDTGIGMTPVEVESALRPFGQLDGTLNRADQSGTGLGLTIVQALVRLHGGRFRLHSEKGRGTTVTIVMPAYRVLRPMEEAQTPAQTQKQTQNFPPRDNKTA